MGALYEAMAGLSSTHSAEVLDGFRRYESLLMSILSPEQIEIYADYVRQTGEIRIFEEMTPAELASLPAGVPVIAASILADTNISMENRRVVSLLNQYGEHEITPDFLPRTEAGLPSEADSLDTVA